MDGRSRLPVSILYQGSRGFAGSPGSGPCETVSSSASAANECRSGFAPLREEAERRGKLIKAASERHAPPGEACTLIGNFAQAEIKMIEYVESHAAECELTPQLVDQLKTGHKNTETMRLKICAVAQREPQRGPFGPGDFETLPEKKL